MDYLSRPRMREILAESDISELDQHYLSRVIGGNMDDIERVLAAMKRGTSCKASTLNETPNPQDQS